MYSSKPTVKVKRLAPDARLPEYAHDGDAGMDVFSLEDVHLGPGESALIKTGLSIELPKCYEAQVRPRSGLAYKNQVTVLNGPGTIDAPYRGEVGILLINHGGFPLNVTKGMKIAQLVIKPVQQAEIIEVTELTDTSRGEGGFGSTGE